jgi:hypothetical protein
VRPRRAFIDAGFGFLSVHVPLDDAIILLCGLYEAAKITCIVSERRD